MQITKITGAQQFFSPSVKVYTTEELQREYDYYMAQKLLKSLLDAGLISVGEFNKITAENRRTFSPYLAQIMPEIT